MSLTLTYAEIRRELGRFLGINEDPTQWSSEDTTRVADVIRRGSRRFYFPEPSMLDDKNLLNHSWSFIQGELSVSLTADTTYHALPSDFVRLSERPSIAGSNLPLEEVRETDIRNLNNSQLSTGEPQYYAIKRSDSGEALSYRIALHPKPRAGKTLEGWYLFQPAEPSASQAPIVPAIHSEAFMAALFATADEMLNYETQSEGRHLERFKTLLAAAIAFDSTIGAEQN